MSDQPQLTPEVVERIRATLASTTPQFQAILDEATRTFTNFVNALESAGFDLDADPDQAAPDTSQAYFLDLIKRIDGMSGGA